MHPSGSGQPISKRSGYQHGIITYLGSEMVEEWHELVGQRPEFEGSVQRASGK